MAGAGFYLPAIVATLGIGILYLWFKLLYGCLVKVNPSIFVY
jgi:hypothetical protein